MVPTEDTVMGEINRSLLAASEFLGFESTPRTSRTWSIAYSMYDENHDTIGVNLSDLAECWSITGLGTLFFLLHECGHKHLLEKHPAIREAANRSNEGQQRLESACDLVAGWLGQKLGIPLEAIVAALREAYRKYPSISQDLKYTPLAERVANVENGWRTGTHGSSVDDVIQRSPSG